jgi:hypothetical protein
MHCHTLQELLLPSTWCVSRPPGPAGPTLPIWTVTLLRTNSSSCSW